MLGERTTRSGGRRGRYDLGDDLRASDAEREHVIDLLQRAVGMGMLDLDEFGQRTEAALAAITRTTLSAVLLDLPGTMPDEPLTNGDVLVLRTRLSEVTRRGAWQVPRRVLISSRLGTTRLDFTEARFAGSGIDIELDVTAGTVDLLVPETATVDATAVTVLTGDPTDLTTRRGKQVGRRGDPVGRGDETGTGTGVAVGWTVPGRTDGPGDRGPSFVLSGRLRAAQLRIHRPSYLRLGPILVRLPLKVAWSPSGRPTQRGVAG